MSTINVEPANPITSSPVALKEPTPVEIIAERAATAAAADKAIVAKLTEKDRPWGVETHVITPAAAALIFRDHNGTNREIKPKWKIYKNEIEKGQWKRNKETIAFDVTGKLRDGQHRVLGCAAANVPIEIGITFGESVDAAEFYDAGQPRTAADILHMHGAVDAGLRERVVKTVVNYEQRAKPPHKAKALTRSEIVEHADRHGSTIAIAIGLARRSLERPKGQSPSWKPCLKEAEAAAAAMLALNGGWTSAQVGSFLSGLQLGLGTGDNDPIEQCATKLTADREKGAKCMAARQRLSLVAQTLVLHASNKRRRLITPKASEQLADFTRPPEIPLDLLGDGMPLASGSSVIN